MEETQKKLEEGRTKMQINDADNGLFFDRRQHFEKLIANLGELFFPNHVTK